MSYPPRAKPFTSSAEFPSYQNLPVHLKTTLINPANIQTQVSFSGVKKKTAHDFRFTVTIFLIWLSPFIEFHLWISKRPLQRHINSLFSWKKNFHHRSFKTCFVALTSGFPVETVENTVTLSGKMHKNWWGRQQQEAELRYLKEKQHIVCKTKWL